MRLNCNYIYGNGRFIEAGDVIPPGVNLPLWIIKSIAFPSRTGSGWPRISVCDVSRWRARKQQQQSKQPQGSLD
jgi:hypothetical protein